jgi:hypothetical protein
MTVNHVIVAKLVKAAQKAGLKPEVIEYWPEQNEKLFRLTAANKARSVAGDAKPKAVLEALRASSPDLFIDPVQRAGDGKRNPWSAKNWNFSKQLELVKVLGAEKAAQIAKAGGSFLGATKPGARNFTQSYERGANGTPVRK